MFFYLVSRHERFADLKHRWFQTLAESEIPGVATYRPGAKGFFFDLLPGLIRLPWGGSRAASGHGISGQTICGESSEETGSGETGGERIQSRMNPEITQFNAKIT
jgi:hypothetical protein